MYEIDLNRHVCFDSLQLSKHCLYSIVNIDWINSDFILFKKENCCELPKYVYVPFHKKFIVANILNSDYVARILIGNNRYFEVNKFNVLNA